MNRESAIRYLEKRMRELSNWMSITNNQKEKDSLFSKYIKIYSVVEILKEELEIS